MNDRNTTDIDMSRTAILAGRLFIACVWLTLGCIMIFAFYLWDSHRNHGWTFGYYGEMNRVAQALAEIPDIRVISSYANNDIVLEEFGFRIHTEGHSGQTLHVSESDPLRNFAGTELLAELKRRLGVRR